MLAFLLGFTLITNFCKNTSVSSFLNANRPHEDYPPNYSSISKRALTTFCFITSFSVLIFYYFGKEVFLQMAYFLNMKNKIGTVCLSQHFLVQSKSR